MSETTSQNQNAVPVVVVQPPVKRVEDTGVLPIEGQVTKEDLVSISVVQEENKLIRGKNHHEAALNKLRGEVNELLSNHQKLGVKVIHNEFDEVVDDLLKTIVKAKFSKPQVHFNINADDEEKEINFSIHLANSGIEQHGKRPYTNEMKDILKEVASKRKEIKVLEEQLLQIKSAINNLPRFERQVRATLAAHSIQQSDKGQQLLKMLQEQNVTSNLKFLPKGDE